MITVEENGLVITASGKQTIMGKILRFTQDGFIVQIQDNEARETLCEFDALEWGEFFEIGDVVEIKREFSIYSNRDLQKIPLNLLPEPFKPYKEVGHYHI